jgi:hypothetical protein
MVQTDKTDCWLPFDRDAAAGRTTFVLTHSPIPTSAHASTTECAHALITELALEAKPAATGSSASGGNWPLLQRCDAGRFHVGSYPRTNANAHLARPRNLAEVWQVLDAVERSP